MKPVLAFALAMSLAAAASTACAGTFASSSGTFGSSKGTFGKSGSDSGGFGATNAPAPRIGTRPAPVMRSTPTTPMAPTAPRIGADRFEPYKGSSVYSDRGGVNAYPKPAKPKGYIDVYGKSGF